MKRIVRKTMFRKQLATTGLASPVSSIAIPSERISPAASSDISMADRGRRSPLARAVVGVLAMTMWLAPLQVSLQQAKQAAGVLAAGAVPVDALAMHAGAVRGGMLQWAVNHLPVTFAFGLREADAAPIVDPSAPVRFQPTLTTTTGPGAPAGGVPVVQIPTPNQQGISVSQYRSFVVDPIGLILSNNVGAGGSFLGGQVAANPNLASSGPASLIIQQVTSTSPALLNGPVEIYGATAGLVIAAPGGVFTNGAAFTNANQVTLTSGVPQFLTAAGAPTSFDAAAAAGFLVGGGRIQINNPTPGNPNGVGIEGTVGSLNLIGESVGVDGKLYAGNQINIVAGRQQVNPVVGAGSSGGFTTTATGSNDAATNTTAIQGIAIDATAFGAMNAGQISILSTATGLGVKAVGNLAASASHLTLDSAGNLTVGDHYAKGNVALTAGGNLAAGNGQAEGSYTARAARDATLTGTLASNQSVTVNAGGSIAGAGGVTAQQATTLAAGGSVDVGGAVSGAQVTVSAGGNDGKGDIHLGGSVTSPGAIQLSAARDTTIDGSAISAGDLNLSTQRNLTINGAAGSTGGNVVLAGQTGSVTTTGNVVSPGLLTVNAGTDATLGGQVVANGPIAVTAQSGSIRTSGQIGSNADLTLVGAQNVTIGGQAQSAGNTVVTATGGSATIVGALTSNGTATITAANDATVAGSLASRGDATIQATSGSASVAGSLVTQGNATVKGGQNTTLAGSVLAAGNLTAGAGQTLTVGSLPYIGGSATLRGNDVTIGSAPTQDNAVAGTLDVAATNRLTLAGNTQAANAILAGAAVANTGQTVVTQALSVTGGTVSNAGMLVGGQATINATDLVNRGTLGGQTVNVSATNTLDNGSGLIVGAQTLNVTTGVLASNAGGTLFAGDLSGKSPTVGDLTLTVNGADGSFNNAAGRILAGNTLTVNTPSQTFDPSATAIGTLNANNTVTLSVLALNNTGTWNVPGANIVLNASQGIANAGTIQKAGDLSLSTGGAFTNSGQIVGGNNLSLSAGTLTNTGTIHADGGLSINADTVNRGVAEALGNIAIAGANYDNTGARTQANGKLTMNVGGAVSNVGGVIGANGDVNITAASVINDRTAPVDNGSTTQKVINDALLNSTVIGNYQPYIPQSGNCESCSGNATFGPPTNITIGDVPRNADGTTISPVLGYIPRYGDGESGSTVYLPEWHIGAVPGSGAPVSNPPVLNLPTVDRTIVSQTDGVAGQIISGGNLGITASTLSNKGGVISAARDVTLNVASLDNGRSAQLANGVTDTVNQGDLNAFLAQLRALTQPNSVTGYDQLMFGTIPPSCAGDNCGAPPVTASAMTVGTAANGTQVTAPTQTSVTYQLGKAGQITAGGNLALNGTGDLSNAGNIAAAGNVRITTPGTFTNQGVYSSQITSTPGCVPGADCPDDSNPTVQSLAWQQTPSTIAAGSGLTINAGNIQNLNATLAAQGNVAMTAAGTVTNQAGAIQSLSADVSITAAALVNKSMDPVQLRKSYGGQNPPYAGGCNPGGTYGNSQCAAMEDTAAGPAAVIQGARDVSIQTGTLANHGALISGGRNVNIQASGGVDNTAIALNADWVGRWQEDRSGGDRWHDTAGRSVLGSIASGIQAGNTLTVNAGGQIVNTGNLMGNQVDLSGAALVNGFTTPTQPTPPAITPQQVISLAPPAGPTGGLPATTAPSNPTPPWQFKPAIVTTPQAPNTSGPQTVDWHFTANLGGTPVTAPGTNVNGAQYLNPNPATAVLGRVTPDALLNALPASLRPGGGVSFYYDPYTEDQKLQQAALQQTGQNSFINGLTYDSQYQLSVTDQEKLALYNNAANYAKANNIPLGTALTQQQINALDKPMLWYVEQTVPDPNCNAVASTMCAQVTALVPQVYLPEGYAQGLTTQAGGTIAGQNVDIDVAGQLRNSGQIWAADTLSVKADSLDLSPNVADIGTNAYKAQGGWNVITGTVVQPGGFMSAAHMSIDADAINAVNDALRILNPDGTTNQAATDALIAQLKANLGDSFTTGTLTDDLHSQFIKEKKGGLFGSFGAIIAMVAAVAFTLMAQPQLSALIGSAFNAGAGTFMAAAAGTMSAGVGNIALSTAIASVGGSLLSQGIASGRIDVGSALKAGLISGVTAGLTAGALGALKLDGAGINSLGDNIAKGNWVAAQSNLGNYLQASLLRSAISAGVNTVAYGGSFGQAFANGLVRDAAALGANAIGVTLPGIGTEGSSAGTILANVAGHALLGCAAQSLTGGDCAGGAVGGAASAIAAPLIRDAVYANSPVLNYSDDPARQALTVGLATLIGGAAGTLLGTNATSAALAAQNESLNNATSHGPARGIAARENARLTKLCEPDCTQEDFNRIDTQVRKVEEAAMRARMSNLTPEQAMKLADSLSNLLPYYGSAAMLYQAVTGQTLSGQELGTADRWLSGILGAVPVGTVAYARISEFVAAKGVGAVGGATGTVWDSIKATQPTYTGSVIPKSFEMSLPNGKNVWVHGNATEHLAEYAQMVAANSPPNVVRLTTQQQLASLQGAVNTATQGSVPYNQLVKVGGWELKFAPPRQPGQMPALIHALPTGK